MQDELDYWRNHAENLENTLSETRAALDEFQVSSRELEEELEKELQTTEKVCGDLKARCEQLKRESEEWKVNCSHTLRLLDRSIECSSFFLCR